MSALVSQVRQFLTVPRLASSEGIYEAFLPEGFPESVSADYVPYQVFDSIQALASSFTGTLATKAMLHGYGVGNTEATAAGATIQWVRASFSLSNPLITQSLTLNEGPAALRY